MKSAGRRRPAGAARHAALRAAPLVTAALLTLPVAIGTAGIVLPFGWLDLLTGTAARLDWSRPFGQAVAEFAAAPGIWSACDHHHLCPYRSLVSPDQSRWPQSLYILTGTEHQRRHME